MSFSLIPSGSFLMGNNENEESLQKDFQQYENFWFDFKDEGPLHKVTISKPFWMGQYPVTIEQFEVFLKSSGYIPESIRDGTGGYGFSANDSNLKEAIFDEVFDGRNVNYSWNNTGFNQENNSPVVNITWNDATAMAKWLSEKEGKRYRLPTEAEWEYACKAGSNTRYFTGDRPDSLISYAKVFDVKTSKIWPQWEKYALPYNSHYYFSSPVGSFLPNDFGLYDMIGNVWEWCSDWYDENYYQNSPSVDPQGPSNGNCKVRRGGSWHTWPLYCRSSFRNINTPDTRYILVGMRFVVDY